MLNVQYYQSHPNRLYRFSLAKITKRTNVAHSATEGTPWEQHSANVLKSNSQQANKTKQKMGKKTLKQTER